MGALKTATPQSMVQSCSGILSVCQTSRLVSLAGGGALLFWGIKRRDWSGLAVAALGADLVARGVFGRGWIPTRSGTAKARGGASTSVGYKSSIRVDQTVTVNKPLDECYRFWRNLENLPRFMEHIESVKVIDETHSHWIVKGPAGLSVEWNAEIINDIPNRLIGWRSLEGADVDNAGSVRFERLAGRGTVVKVVLRYDPPAGTLGGAFSRWLGEDPEEQVATDLRRFKQIMETGEAGDKMPELQSDRQTGNVRRFPNGRREEHAG